MKTLNATICSRVTLLHLSNFISEHKGGFGYRYFLRQLGDHALAEDYFQDIWSKSSAKHPKISN